MYGSVHKRFGLPLMRETIGVEARLSAGDCAGADDGEGGAHDIVAVAASLGGSNALSRVLAELPPDFPLPILVVQHLCRGRRSFLPDVLARRTALRVKSAQEGDRPTPGHVHVAPPDRHLVVRSDGALGLLDGDLVNFCRPSADVLFRSLADVFSLRAIAVVLSGLGRDGARGVEAIVEAGGAAIAQDAASAEAADMPSAAVEIGHADLVLPPDRIGFALSVLAERPRSGVSFPRPAAFASSPRAQGPTGR